MKLKQASKKNFRAIASLNILRSISVLWIGSVAGAGFALLTQVILARGLGPNDFGKFASAFAIITICTPLAGFGAHSLLLKVYGQEGWNAKRWLKPIFHYSIVTSTITSLAILALSLTGDYSNFERFYLLLLVPLIGGQAAFNLVSSKLQLEGRYIALSLWQLAVPTSRLTAITVLFFVFKENLSVMNVVVTFCGLGIFFIYVSIDSLKRIETPQFNLKGHSLDELANDRSLIIKSSEIAKNSWGFGLSGLLYLVYYQSDIVLLEHISGATAAGIYNVAYLTIGATYILPGVIFQKYLLPQLHRWASRDVVKLAQVYKKGSILMLLCGLISAVFVFFISPYFVLKVFGNAYKEAVDVLAILVFCVPMRFLSSSADAVLTSGNQLNNKVKLQAVVALANVICNLIYIPTYGVWAAAYITVLSELAMSVLMHVLAYRHLKPHMHNLSK